MPRRTIETVQTFSIPRMAWSMVLLGLSLACAQEPGTAPVVQVDDARAAAGASIAPEASPAMADTAPPGKPGMSGQQASFLSVASLDPHPSYELRRNVSPRLNRPNEGARQHFFSGRRVDVTTTEQTGPALAAGQESIALVRRDPNTGVALDSRALPIERRRAGYLRLFLPGDLGSGTYTLDIPRGKAIDAVPLTIEGWPGWTEAESQPDFNAKAAVEVAAIHRLGCGDCYWELALAMHPSHPDVGYLVGVREGFAWTTNAWASNEVFNIHDLIDPAAGLYWGDPQFAFLPNGRMLLANLTFLEGGMSGQVLTGGYFQSRSPAGVRPRLEQVIVRPLHDNMSRDIVLDFPKIAVDRQGGSPFRGSIYLSATVTFEDGSFGGALYTIRDGEIQERKTAELGFDQDIQSIQIGPGGVIYHVGFNDSFGRNLDLALSTDGGASFETRRVYTRPDNAACGGGARLSTNSPRSWALQIAPKLAVARNGRLYYVWAQFKDCIRDTTFETSLVAYDFDVFLTVSDDQGRSWSEPVRVNDDQTDADQGFPNVAVDDDGAVYVAFIDRRRTQDEARYDIYLAKSEDGGQSFLRNIRVNDQKVPMALGGREPGDYLDMIAIGDDAVFVGHPCVGPGGENAETATDACVAVVPKSGGTTPPPDGGCSLPVGHGRYCTECGPCTEGQGDCDGDGDCVNGTSCVDNVGADFGFAPGIDVCLASDGPAPPPDGGCSLPVGHGRYCTECGPCTEGQGDCDSDADCANGTSCVDNIGADFGFAPGVDVCMAEAGGGPSPPPGGCSLPLGHGRYCTECGPCGAGQGDCDSDADCANGTSCVDNVGADFGFAPGVDVCVAGAGGEPSPPPGGCSLPLGHGRYCTECGPCGAGQGDCDVDADCANGTSCVDNVGADFGFAPGVDVCVAGGT